MVMLKFWPIIAKAIWRVKCGVKHLTEPQLDFNTRPPQSKLTRRRIDMDMKMMTDSTREVDTHAGALSCICCRLRTARRMASDGAEPRVKG